jgi:hypothetical protein
MDPERFLFRIPRADVEAMDSSAVQRHFDVSRLTPAELRAMFGCVTYRLDGYDAHPAELFTIPDVRRFVRQWHESCPHWIYFGALDGDNLSALYFSMLDSVECVQRGGAGLSTARYDTGELTRLLAADLEQADALRIRAGLTEGQRWKRATDILRYFHFI